MVEVKFDGFKYLYVAAFLPSMMHFFLDQVVINSMYSGCEFEQCMQLKENSYTEVTEVGVVKFPDAMMQSRRLMRGIGILWVPKTTILFSRYIPSPSEVAEVVGITRVGRGLHVLPI